MTDLLRLEELYIGRIDEFDHDLHLAVQLLYRLVDEDRLGVQHLV